MPKDLIVPDFIFVDYVSKADKIEIDIELKMIIENVINFLLSHSKQSIP